MKHGCEPISSAEYAMLLQLAAYGGHPDAMAFQLENYSKDFDPEQKYSYTTNTLQAAISSGRRGLVIRQLGDKIDDHGGSFGIALQAAQFLAIMALYVYF